MSIAADAAAASPPFRAEPLLRSPGDRRPTFATPPHSSQLLDGNVDSAARREKSHRSPVPCVAHDTYTFHHNCGCVTPPRIYSKVQRKSPTASHTVVASAEVPLLDPVQEIEGKGTATPNTAMTGATHEVACLRGPSRASFVSVMKDNSPAAVLLLTVSRGRAPRSVVHALEMRDDRIYLVERDALSGVLLDERRAPISNDAREPQPTCMAVVCEAIMIGLSDGVILCWEKLLSSSATAPTSSPAGPQGRHHHQQLLHSDIATTVSAKLPLDAAPAEVASHCVDTVLSRWTRLGATKHHSSVIGLWSLGELSLSKAEAEGDAMISVCASGQALVWCRTAPSAEESMERPLRRPQWFARSLVVPQWRNFECSSSLFWSSLAARASLQQQQHQQQPPQSSETQSIRAFLAMGTTCGKVVTWVDPSGWSDDSRFCAADLVRCAYRTDVSGHVAVTSLACAEVEHRGSGGGHATTTTTASPLLLCAGLASGSVNIYAFDGESAAGSSGGNCWRGLRQVEAFSQLLVQGLTFIDSVRCWCAAANGHVAIIDCMACAVVDRISLEGSSARHRKPSALPAHGRRPAALVHAEFVCGHVLWSVDPVGLARNVLVPSEGSPLFSHACHPHHLASGFRILSQPSLDDDINLSFAAARPSEDAVSTNTAPLSDDLAEFERVERSVAAVGGTSATRALADGGGNAFAVTAARRIGSTGAAVSPSSEGVAAGTSSGSTADFVEFLKTAGCELQMVQQRLDEHLVVLHDVVEDQLSALCNLRANVAAAPSASSIPASAATAQSVSMSEELGSPSPPQQPQHHLLGTRLGIDTDTVNDLAERVAILTELLAAKDRQLDEQAHALQILKALAAESSPAADTRYTTLASHEETADDASRDGATQRQLVTHSADGEEREEAEEREEGDEGAHSRLGGGASRLSAAALMLNSSARSEDDSRLSPISIPDHSSFPPLRPSTAAATTSAAGVKDRSIDSAAGDVARGDQSREHVNSVAVEEPVTQNREQTALAADDAFSPGDTAATAQIHLYQRMLTLEQDKCAALRQSLSVATAQVASVTQERDALSLRCAGFEDKVTQLEAALQRHAEALQGADAELTRSRSKLDHLQNIATKAEQRYDAVAAENANLRERLKAMVWTKEQMNATSPSPAIKRKSSAATSALPQRDVQRPSQQPVHEAAVPSSEEFDAQLDVIEGALASLSALAQHSGGATARVEQLREELLEAEQQRSGERKQWMAKYVDLQERNGKEVEGLRRKLDDATRERNAAAAVCAMQHLPAVDERDQLREEKKRLVQQIAELSTENDLLRAETENKERVIKQNRERESLASEESTRLRDVLVDLDERGVALAEEIVALTASRDREAARAIAAEGEIRKLTQSESSLQSAANELALRLAYCEEQVGVWQAKFGEVEEELRQMVHDSHFDKTGADRARANEREAQEEICDLRRKLHETVTELQRNLGDEIRLRLLEEQKALRLQQEIEALQQQLQVHDARCVGNNKLHLPGDVVALEEQNTLLSQKIDELEAALAAAKFSAATQVPTCELNVGSHVLEAENYSLRKQINQLNWRIAMLGKQLEGKPSQQQNVAVAESASSAFSKQGTAKSTLGARERGTGLPSGFAQARKVKETTAKPTAVPDPKSVSDEGRRRNWTPNAADRRSDSNNTRRSPSVAAVAAHPAVSHREASDSAISLDVDHHAHHRHGHGQASDCVWCSGLTFKSMGGTFGVNTVGTRFLEFDRSPTSGHAGSQLFAGTVSPTPEKRSLSARTVSPPVAATLVSPRAADYRGTSKELPLSS